MIQKRGFTLMELMLTVVIIAILVSIAIPSYIDTVERARAREAVATLQTVRSAELTYAAERRTFINLTDNDRWAMIGLENPNNNAERSWDYDTTNVGAGTVTVRATRNSGRYDNGWITLNQDGTTATGGGWPF
ncbi:MAG: prepilin-type N-terminal cleavage/methylation domain-containing protein [Candidatus Omnitrophica bacterium]|nr:prepilin-type N-terminal cleavage/methylation domain-containing protein [Candidatus Omnitrophota bacterium]